MQPSKIPDHPVVIQRPAQVLDTHQVLLLVRSKLYGSEGVIPVDERDCPYFQQHHTATSCVSSSGASGCAGFFGTTSQGETRCGWLPRRMIPGQRYVLNHEDRTPAQWCAPWN